MFWSFFKKKKRKIAELSPEQDHFLGTAIEEYNNSLAEFNDGLRFSDFDEWGYDQYSNKFVLKNNDLVEIEADAQIIGSYSRSGKSWEWSWNNPHVEKESSRDSHLVRKYGEKEELWYLTEGLVPVVNDTQPIYFAAVGKKITNSQAVYAGPAGDITVYLLLKNITERAETL